MDIIAYAILANQYSINRIRDTFLLKHGEIAVLFADLTAVIRCESDTSEEVRPPLPHLEFLHASLRDFLVDKNRSNEYYLDLKERQTNLLCMLITRTPPNPKSDQLMLAENLERAIVQERQRLEGILGLLYEVTESERLRVAFMNFDYTLYTWAKGDHCYVYDQMMLGMKRLV